MCFHVYVPTFICCSSFPWDGRVTRHRSSRSMQPECYALVDLLTYSLGQRPVASDRSYGDAVEKWRNSRNDFADVDCGAGVVTGVPWPGVDKYEWNISFTRRISRGRHRIRRQWSVQLWSQHGSVAQTVISWEKPLAAIVRASLICSLNAFTRVCGCGEDTKWFRLQPLADKHAGLKKIFRLIYRWIRSFFNDSKLYLIHLYKHERWIQ